MKRDLRSDSKGFTLIELLVVIAIIAVLIALALCPRFRPRAKRPGGVSAPTISSSSLWLAIAMRTALRMLADRS